MDILGAMNVRLGGRKSPSIPNNFLHGLSILIKGTIPEISDIDAYILVLVILAVLFQLINLINC